MAFDNALMFYPGTDSASTAPDQITEGPGVSLATGSGEETVATHNSEVLDLGVGDTLTHKVVSGAALSGIMQRYESDLEYLVQITETITSGGAATLAVTLYNSTSSTLASGNTQIGAAMAATALASLVAGLVCLRGSLKGQRLSSRYLGCQHAIATAALTNGRIYGGLGFGLLGAQARTAY